MPAPFSAGAIPAAAERGSNERRTPSSSMVSPEPSGVISGLLRGHSENFQKLFTVAKGPGRSLPGLMAVCPTHVPLTVGDSAHP